MGLPILYEDDDLWILDKPPGLHSVSLTGGDESMATRILDSYPEISAVAEKPGDAGLVNRLDQDTSGILIGAKKKEIWLALRMQIQTGRIFKTYVALVEGLLTSPIFVNNFIGSPYRRASKVRTYETAPRSPHRALAAETSIRLLATDAESSTSLVVASAPTARRHQIRAHCSYVGHPLVGDTLYGSTRSLTEACRVTSSRSFYLHCDECSLVHPVTNEKLTIRAPFDVFLEDTFPSSRNR